MNSLNQSKSNMRRRTLSEEEDCARDVINDRAAFNTAQVSLPQGEMAEEKSIQDYDREIRRLK